MKLTLVLIASVLVLTVIGEPSTAASSLTRNKIRGRIRRRTDNDDYGEYTMVDTLRVVPNDKTGSFDRKESHYVVSDPDSNYQPEEHISTNVISGGGVSDGSSSHYHHSSKQSIGTDQALEEAQKRYLSLIGGFGDDSDNDSDNDDDDDDEASESDQVSAASFDPSKRSLSNGTLDRFQPKQKVNDHINLPVGYAGRYNKEKEEEPRNLYQSKGNPIDHHRHHHYHEQQQQQQQQQHGHHPDKADTTTTTVTTTTTTTTTKSDSKKNNGKNSGKKNKQKKKGKGGKNKNKNKKKNQPVTNITDNSENVNASKNINQTINIPSTESRKAVSLSFLHLIC
jgi:hypothetical protein